ncbi:MAG: M20/M25/M40 family metallo-hydrolase [Planctomycetaceae bacterium]|nr:M20/M25/M40 family metallo-hydrolase [Planctomycetaceae bacterium]
MKWPQVVLALSWCQALALASLADAPVEPSSEAIRSITASEIGGHLRFLASDLMKGRDTGSPETRLAAEYLAAGLFAASATPLGDPVPTGRTYFQNFSLEEVTPLEQGTSLELSVDTGDSRRIVPCKLGEDFILDPHGIVAGEIDAPVIFAGYGRLNPDQKIDDFAGLDVKNQFVLIYDGEPEKNKTDSGTPTVPLFDPFPKRQAAQRKGALGILVIKPPACKTPAAMIPFSPANQGFGNSRTTLGITPASMPVLILSDPVRDLLEGWLGLDAERKPPGTQHSSLRARFRFADHRVRKTDRNVLGFFPGADPEKSKEFVIFSAHYDHVGVNDKGEIFNGSDDNASGTGGLLEIAEAFGKAPRPLRSVAFLWVSGEEKGLLGSHWFADHPTLLADSKIVADINLDMISRNDRTKISITPSPQHDEYNSLVPAALVACKAEGIEVVFDADQFFHRSDSSSFARLGVPVIFFFAGIHADYHRPTDDYDAADLEKAAHVARAAFRLGWQVAQGSDIPKKIQAEAGEIPGPTASRP